jgi:hypothetical protein
MNRLSKVRAKVKHDEAMNLTELALFTGYDRNTLGGMVLPLQGGKIFYSDFRRILAARQDRHEHSLASIRPISPIDPITKPSGEEPGEVPQTSSLADRFHAPKSTRARPAASHARAGSRPHSTGLQRKRA